ncbi:MAG: YidC/Oxa1 family insertase periplasmic-domain containing protein [Candidatus Omnitrophica bacterium]|nr:YidC/Oxa1 family insertase periplasmic-domain containing protein [Candidatus Omnitrophota bacterium]
MSLKRGGSLFYEAGLEGKGIFGLRLLNEPGDLRQEIFEVSETRDGAPQLTYEKAGEYRITKKFFFGEDRPTFVQEIDFENLSDREKNFTAEIDYALKLGAVHGQDEMSVERVQLSAGEVRSAKLKNLRKGVLATAEPAEWHGLLRRFEALLVKPDWKIVGEESEAEGDNLVSRLKLAPLAVAPGEQRTARLLVYAGPQKYGELKSLGLDFEKILTQGMLGTLRLWMLLGLDYFFHLTGNYGVAILVLTLLIKLLFTPLTHFSYQSMGKMQALQPKMKALQSQHKNDPQRLNKEMMELYRRNRVNPLGGCLPMVLQIPIFIAFYQVLSTAADIKGAAFIGWVRDLSEPDRLFSWPSDLPFIGHSFNLLPVLMIGSMLWQQKLTPQTTADPMQQKIMYLMPIVFGFVFYNLPSGLVLYWLVNNLLTIFHQLVIKRIPVILHHEDR